MKIKNGILYKVTNEDIIEGEFIIPNSITEIKNNAFSFCDDLKSIDIPNSVTKIGKYAFYNCINLIYIDISNSINEIKEDTFANCESLKSIIIPDSVTKIGNYAFYNSGLISIIIPNSVDKIGNSAFANCKELTSIILPTSITEISNYLFSYCYELNLIIIPDSIKLIWVNSFYKCKKLQSKLGNYKAFEKGLICNNMQYIANEWNNVEGDIKLCNWGLHYVTNLFDIFTYYSGNLEEDIEIWEVETGDVIVNNSEDSKKATNAIFLKHKLTIKEIIDILNNKA